MRDGSLESMTTNQLKEEYISCWFGQMIYGAKTLERRNAIAEEIERRESQK